MEPKLIHNNKVGCDPTLLKVFQSSVLDITEGTVKIVSNKHVHFKFRFRDTFSGSETVKHCFVSVFKWTKSPYEMAEAFFEKESL